MRRTAAVVATFALLLSLVPAVAARTTPSTWIVQLRAGIDPAVEAADLARQFGGSVGRVYEHAINGFTFRGSEAAATALARHPRVAVVEANAEVWLDTTQTNATWGLDRIDQPLLPLSGTYTYQETGASVTAYVIDSGIRYSHSDFGGRAVLGTDIVGGVSPAGSDCNGHGTHVAGTIGGATWGVAKAVTLVSVRVFGCDGGSTWDVIIAGIDWVIANHQAGTPAVANMSLGGGGNSSIDTATRNLIGDGVATAVAAGNGDFLGRQQDACNYSPARVAEAMTISATNSSDAKASWANYGNCVDWFAPGVSIVSASHGSDTGSTTKSGTSMAAPHTAGVAALYLQASPAATPQTVRDAIFAQTTKDIVTSSSTANNDLLYMGFLNDSGGGDTTAPSVSISSPTGGTVSGTVTIQVNASDTVDPAGTLNVDVAVDGTFADTTYNSTSDRYELTWDTTTGADGSHTIDARAVDAAGNTGNAAQVTITVDNGTDGGDASVMHVSDLDRSSQNNGSTWTATVTITVRDGTGATVSGVTVSGTWSNGTSGTGSCTTNSSGVCSMSKSSIPKRTGSVIFSVTTLAKTGLTYDSAANSDPDTDSNGTTITILKP